MSIDLGAVALSVTPDLKDFAPQLNKGIRDSMRRVGGTLQKTGAIATGVITAPILAGFAKATDAASSLNESVNAVNVVFGEGADRIHEFAKIAAGEAGLSMRAFNQAAAPMGAILQDAGYAADEAADSTIDLATRAADMASVFDTDVSTALAAIESGLRGEMEPLGQFAAKMSAAEVQAYALANGIAAEGREMTENEKVRARTGLLLEKTNKVAGDYKNTIGDVANAERNAAGEAENLAAQFGEKLLPIKLKAIQLGTSLLDRFNALSPAGQSLAMVIAGVAAAVGPLLVVVGTLMKSLVALGPVLTVLTGPVGLVIAAVAALAAGLIYAYKHSETFRKVVDTAFTLARLSITSAMTQIRSVISTATSTIGAIWQRWGADILSFARTTFDNIRLLVAGVLRVIKGIIDLFLGVVTGDWRRAWDGIKSILSGAWDAIRAITGQALNAMQTIVKVGLGVVAASWRRVFGDMKEAVRERLDAVVDFFKAIPGRVKDVLSGLADVVKDAFTFDLPSMTLPWNRGDGPGAPIGAGGRAYDRARQLAMGLPITTSSVYRTPEQNRRAGGSPTSYHMDRNNPASDWVGPTWALDEFAARLRASGGWRELLWRVPNHAPGDNPHVHVADQGGVFKGPGYVYMGAGYETFASGLAAEKVAPQGGDSGRPITVVLEINGHKFAQATAPEMQEEIRVRDISYS